MGHTAEDWSWRSEYEKPPELLLRDTFEDGFSQWQLSESGAGSTIRLAVLRARLGAYSCRLVTNDNVDESVQLRRIFPFPSIGTLAMECSFSMTGTYPALQMRLYIYTGSVCRVAWIKYSPANQALYYFDQAQVWQELLTDLDMAVAPDWWSTLRLSADFDVGEYLRVQMDGSDLDMSGIPLYEAANTDPARAYIWILAQPESAAASTVYIDDVTIIQGKK